MYVPGLVNVAKGHQWRAWVSQGYIHKHMQYHYSSHSFMLPVKHVFAQSMFLPSSPKKHVAPPPLIF